MIATPRHIVEFTPARVLEFPRCISLSVEFNRHAIYYQTASKWADDEHGGRQVTWVSDEERSHAIETDTIWVVGWYPSTPIGSCDVAGSSLSSVLNYIAQHNVKP